MWLWWQRWWGRPKYLPTEEILRYSFRVGILGVCHIDGDNYEEYDLKLWDIWCLWCLWWWGRTRDNDEKHMISIWSIYGDSDNDDDEEHMISIWNIKFDRRFSPSSLPFQLKCQRQRVGQTPFSIFNSLSFYSIISTAGALVVRTVDHPSTPLFAQKLISPFQ